MLASIAIHTGPTNEHSNPKDSPCPPNVGGRDAAKALPLSAARPAARLVATAGAGFRQATPDFLFGVAMPVRF
jgi:hypothetical protein